jgi:hypothetical protein
LGRFRVKGLGRGAARGIFFTCHRDVLGMGVDAGRFLWMFGYVRGAGERERVR